MTVVKICGLGRPEDAEIAVRAGADMIGLVFAPSRRRVNEATAREIAARVHEVSQAKVVGVFVNEDLAKINRLARVVRLDYAQLSGGEGDELLAALDLPAIQVIHVRAGTEPERIAHAVEKSTAEVVLLDTAQAGAYGGTGQTFDWELVPATDRPLLLAGGLTPENVARAVTTARPWGVDVSGGVERDGVKDRERILAFLQVAKIVM